MWRSQMLNHSCPCVWLSSVGYDQASIVGKWRRIHFLQPFFPLWTAASKFNLTCVCVFYFRYHRYWIFWCVFLDVCFLHPHNVHPLYIYHFQGCEGAAPSCQCSSQGQKSFIHTHIHGQFKVMINLLFLAVGEWLSSLEERRNGNCTERDLVPQISLSYLIHINKLDHQLKVFSISREDLANFGHSTNAYFWWYYLLEK